MSSARPAPTIFVLFGATGDLAHRMVLPAFATLAADGLLPEDWRSQDPEPTTTGGLRIPESALSNPGTAKGAPRA